MPSFFFFDFVFRCEQVFPRAMKMRSLDICIIGGSGIILLRWGWLSFIILFLFQNARQLFELVHPDSRCLSNPTSKEVWVCRD